MGRLAGAVTVVSVVACTTVTRTFDARPFMRLLNAAELIPGNASHTYLVLERE